MVRRSAPSGGSQRRREIQNENQTLASITFQNYFRLYEKLAGMTGTADTEAFEFSSIYKLDTIVVPTNRPMIRKDMPDLVYMTEKERSAPSSKTSASVPPKASRCWWVPSQSRNPKWFPMS